MQERRNEDEGTEALRHTAEGCKKLATYLLKFKSVGAVIRRQFEIYTDADHLAKFFIDNYGQYHKSCYIRYDELKFQRIKTRLKAKECPGESSDIRRSDRINEQIQHQKQRGSHSGSTGNTNSVGG